MRDKFMTKYSAEFKEAAVRKMTATLLGSGLMEQDTFISAVDVKLVGTSLVKIMLLVAPPGSLVSYSAG